MSCTSSPRPHCDSSGERRDGTAVAAALGVADLRDRGGAGLWAAACAEVRPSGTRIAAQGVSQLYSEGKYTDAIPLAERYLAIARQFAGEVLLIVGGLLDFMRAFLVVDDVGHLAGARDVTDFEFPTASHRKIA